MPDTRSELLQPGADIMPPPAERPVQAKPPALQRWFPPVACALVVGGIGTVTYHMERATAAGHLTGMPYVLLALLYTGIFVAHYFVYKED